MHDFLENDTRIQPDLPDCCRLILLFQCAFFTILLCPISKRMDLAVNRRESERDHSNNETQAWAFITSASFTCRRCNWCRKHLKCTSLVCATAKHTRVIESSTHRGQFNIHNKYGNFIESICHCTLKSNEFLVSAYRCRMRIAVFFFQLGKLRFSKMF